MAKRGQRKGVADDLLAIATKLPWWVSLVIAAIGFFGLHGLASQPPATATSMNDIGSVAVGGLLRTLAWIGQFIVPLIFVVGAVASALGQKKRRALLLQTADRDSPAALSQMTWREFEGLVQESFRLRGYAVRRLGGDGPDGGVDLVLNRGAERVLVQCKQWRAMRVGVSVVRELYGAMAAEGAASGIVVTSGGFTPDAMEFASGRNVRLIAGDELMEMLREARATLQPEQRARTPSEPTGKSARGCPRCGSPMVRREARRGSNAGRAFYGCSRFPDCRGTIAID
jgi:restriction system protein